MTNTGIKVQQIGCTHSYRSLPIGLLAVFLMSFPLPVAAQGTPANNSARQACVANELDGLACALTGQGPGCWDLAISRYNACLDSALNLPPAPLPPTAPPTPKPMNRCPPQGYGEGGLMATNFCVEFVDPVPDLINQAGTGIVTDGDRLAAKKDTVSGVAADSAARLLIRIYAHVVGERFTIELKSDGMDTLNGLPQSNGVLRTIDGATFGTQLQVVAVKTGSGAAAFAQYFPPNDFSRGGADDKASNRTVPMHVTSNGSSWDTAITIWRPPVLLVHGIWGRRSNWDHFTPFNSDPRFLIVARADYRQPLIPVSSSDPAYDFPIIAQSSALGFALTASPNPALVLADIDKAAASFRKKANAAGVQVDVVAHSMGGLVTRTLEYHPAYTDRTSLGVGKIHKLITIGTPHLGSPLAIDLLRTDPPEATNPCMDKVLTQHDSPVFRTVTPDGPAAPDFNGGVNDLQGDGMGSNLSQALAFLKNTPNSHEAPTALIAGTMTQENTNGLTAYWRHGVSLYLGDWACSGSNEPLIKALAGDNWSTVFGGASSDAVVPYTSQVDSGAGRSFPGLIHSAGMKMLGFSGPTELDPDTKTGIPSYVIQLLNTPSNSAAFRFLSH